MKLVETYDEWKKIGIKNINNFFVVNNDILEASLNNNAYKTGTTIRRPNGLTPSDIWSLELEFVVDLNTVDILLQLNQLNVIVEKSDVVKDNIVNVKINFPYEKDEIFLGIKCSGRGFVQITKCIPAIVEIAWWESDEVKETLEWWV